MGQPMTGSGRERPHAKRGRRTYSFPLVTHHCSAACAGTANASNAANTRCTGPICAGMIIRGLGSVLGLLAGGIEVVQAGNIT